MDFVGTLKSKLGPLPVWGWAILGTAALALWISRHKGQSAADKAAANQTNTDLGTASSLANFFDVAGIMPYSGGDVYVTQTVNSGPSQPVVNKPGGGPLPVPPGRGVKPPKPTKPTPANTANPKSSAPPKPLQVKINTKDSAKWNDTLSGIASHYGMTWQQLFAFNTATGAKGANRSASTIAKLKRRGPDLVYNGTTFYVPKKGTVYSGGY